MSNKICYFSQILLSNLRQVFLFATGKYILKKGPNDFFLILFSVCRASLIQQFFFSTLFQVFLSAQGNYFLGFKTNLKQFVYMYFLFVGLHSSNNSWQ